MSTPTDIETLPLEALHTRFEALRLYSPHGIDGLRASIERHGLMHPLVANRHGERLELLDGFKRRRALEALGQTRVAVRVVALSASAAMAAIATFNAPHRGLCELEEAWLVRALVREHGLQQSQIAELMGRHKSWVCRRLQMAEQLAAEVVDDMRLGLVSATVARELVRLPRGNQAPVALSVSRHGLSTRQCAQLVTGLLESDDAQAKEALLADPLRFVGRQQSTEARRARDARVIGRRKETHAGQRRETLPGRPMETHPGRRMETSRRWCRHFSTS